MAKSVKNKEIKEAQAEKSKPTKKASSSLKAEKTPKKTKAAQADTPKTATAQKKQTTKSVASKTEEKATKTKPAAVKTSKAAPIVAETPVKKQDVAKTKSTKNNKETIAAPVKKTLKEETVIQETSSKPEQKKTAAKKTAATEEPTVPNILQKEKTNAPHYKPREEALSKPENIPFHKIVPLEDMVKALEHAQIHHAELNLPQILQAVLRGSDALVTTTELKQFPLIAAIGATSKILTGSLTRIEAKQPVVLVVAQDENKLKEYSSQANKIFSQLGVHFEFLSEKSLQNEKKLLSEKHIDVLFATPQTLNSAHKNHSLSLASVGLFVAYEFNTMTSQNEEQLVTLLNELPKERVQKVFVSGENTPKVRKLTFEYLDDYESFYLLPSSIKERQPKQFAHAILSTQKFQVLLGHLKHHQPNCAVVFANTRTVAEWIAYKLHGNGVKVELVTSSLNFTKKLNLVKEIQAGEINVIVTTDYQVKSMGFENLNCLYQFDLPNQPQQFIDRLLCIENSKNPISVSFICEDYGYNMGAIEEKLGFKIHVAQPDKEYFKLKDSSDYPLEADGRVKRIGQVYPVAATPAVLPAPTQTIAAPTKPAQAPTTQPEAIAEPKLQTRMPQDNPRLQPRPASAAFSASTSQAKNPSAQQQQGEGKFAGERPKFNPKHGDKFEQRPRFDQNKTQDKYIRRDDKAKEALDAARMAAQEKRKQQQTAQKSAENKNILSLALFIVQDAVKAATTAAKDSLAQNLEENMPMLSKALSKIPFLKKDSR